MDGGGIVSNDGYIARNKNTQSAGSGSKSSFGSLISVTGGSGGYATYGPYEDYDWGTYNFNSIYAGTGGNPNGKTGTSGRTSGTGTVSGGAGFAMKFSVESRKFWDRWRCFVLL